MISRKEIADHFHTNPIVGAVISGVGANNLAFGHSWRQTRDMDLKILHHALIDSKNGMAPALLRQARKEPDAVFRAALNGQKKALRDTARAMALVSPAAGNGLATPAARFGRSFAPLTKKIKALREHERVLDALVRDAARPAWRKALLSPRGVMVSGAVVTTLGAGLAAYEWYNFAKGSAPR